MRALLAAHREFHEAFLRPHCGFQATGGRYRHPEYVVGDVEPTLADLEEQVGEARRKAEAVFALAGKGNWYHDQAANNLADLEARLERAKQ